MVNSPSSSSPAVHTVLVDFSIEAGKISTTEGREKVLSGMLEVIKSNAKDGTMKGLTMANGQFLSPTVFAVVQEDVLFTIRFQPAQGLITLNIEYDHLQDTQPLFSYEVGYTSFIMIYRIGGIINYLL